MAKKKKKRGKKKTTHHQSFSDFEQKVKAGLVKRVRSALGRARKLGAGVGTLV